MHVYVCMCMYTCVYIVYLHILNIQAKPYTGKNASNLSVQAVKHCMHTHVHISEMSTF